MIKSYFMFDWLWSHLEVLECSGAGGMIKNDHLEKMNGEYYKFINKIDP